MNNHIIKLLFNDSTGVTFPDIGDKVSLDSEQILKFVNAIIDECEISSQEVQECSEYSFTPVKARHVNIGAKSVFREFKHRIGIS